MLRGPKSAQKGKYIRLASMLKNILSACRPVFLHKATHSDYLGAERKVEDGFHESHPPIRQLCGVEGGNE